MQKIELNVSSREAGKKHNRALRRQGFCPGVVYGSKVESKNLYIDNRDFTKYFNSKNENLIFKLKSDDKYLDGQLCLRGDFDTHPLNSQPVHVDLHAITEDQVVKRDVSVSFQGKPKALADGGKFRPIIRTIKIEAKVRDLPQVITVDTSHMDIGNSLRVKDIKNPEGVTVLTSENTVAATIDGGNKE